MPNRKNNNQAVPSANGSSNGSGRRGFAAMDPEQLRKVSARGGRASHGGGRRSAQ